jgi:uncharacterized RDD family membrane protein YckC
MEEIFRIITKPNIGKRALAGSIDYVIILTICYYLIALIGEPN